MRESAFLASELKIVRPYSPDGRAITLGNLVRLNSGSPELLVVDIEEKYLTVAWLEGVPVEVRLPLTCVTVVDHAYE